MERTHHLLARGKRHNMNRGGRKRKGASKHRRIVYSGVDSPALNSDPGYDTVARGRADDRSGTIPLARADDHSGFQFSAPRPLQTFLSIPSRHDANERSGLAGADAYSTSAKRRCAPTSLGAPTDDVSAPADT
jgi:hypothetical protein